MVKFVIVFAFFVSSFVPVSGNGGNNGWTGSPFTGPPPTGMFSMGRKGGPFDGRPTGMPPMPRGSPPTGMPLMGPPPTGIIMPLGRGMRPMGSPPPTGMPPSEMPIQIIEGEIRQKRQNPFDSSPQQQQQNQGGNNFGAFPPPYMGNPNNGNNQFGQGPQNGFNGPQQQPFNGNQGGFQPQERSLPTEYGQYSKKRSLPTEYGQYRKK